MKKLLSLLVLLVTTIGATAQDDWDNPHSDNPASRTVIYADFIVNNGEAAYQSNWTLGVFVGDECRMVEADNANSVLQSYNNKQFLQLEVPGDYGDESDQDKPITIKVVDGRGAIYTLTPSETITYNPEVTYGTQPSGPRVQLTLTLPTSITLEEFTCQAGTPVDLTEHMTVVPADAQLPENIEWFIRDSYWDDPSYDDYATVEGNTMTPKKPYISEGENQPIPYGVVISAYEYEDLAETSQFYIEQPAEAITIVTETFETELGYVWELNDFMNNQYWAPGQILMEAYEVTPADFTEEVKWEYDPDYIEYAYSDQIQAYIYRAIKGGTTRIRPYIERADGNLYPEGDKWITVTIIVPVTDIEFDWPFNEQTQQFVTFKANVGDDIYQRIASRVTVEPEDATDRTFQILNYSDGGEEYLTIDNEAKTAVALKAGTTRVLIQPNGRGGEDYFVDFTVEIFDPLKEVTFTDDPLIIDYRDGMQISEVAAFIEGNILWQTESGKEIQQEGTIAVTGQLQGEGIMTGNGPMLNLTNENIPKGESNVTVTLRWNDYSSYDGTDASITTATGTPKSFIVRIIKALEKFDITVTPDTDDPTRGTITLTPNPEDADFDWADYEDAIEIRNWNYDDSWEAINYTDNGNGNYTYDTVLPGIYTVTLADNQEESVEFEVPAKVSYESGWQWKSNPYGFIMATENADWPDWPDLETVFGDNLAEARTYDKLLYNDSEWGYWGSLLEGDSDYPWAIGQARMYKVKMKAAQEAYLYGGEQAEDVEQSLMPGWNWIGSPYFYNRLLSNALPDGEEGMVIVSKADGSAEWNGQTWEGSLKVLKKGQGYLVYSPQEGNLPLALEVFGEMTQGDETPAGARAAHRSVWSYDHSRFASNMTMVAEMPQLNDAEHYSIGAFVGDECRGEGHFIEGLAYITVHANAGEQVLFRLHNELTSEFYDIDQTVSTQTRLGSVKAPVQLTSNAVVTGINSVHSSEFTVHSYDLGGRVVKANAKGMTILRQSDGSVRKVVK